MPLRSGEAIAIREATATDIPAILAIYKAAEIDHDAAFTVEEAMAQLAAFRAYPSYRVFVAEVNGAVAGTYALLVLDNLAKRGRPSAIVEDVAVSPEAQGKGIGRAMLRHAMELCRQAGCYKLALSSNLKRTAAHDFYEHLGFERHGYSYIVPIE